jgi:hypothetical protein
MIFVPAIADRRPESSRVQLRRQFPKGGRRVDKSSGKSCQAQTRSS